jgi:hypothetical protein
MFKVTTPERELTYRVVDAIDRGSYSHIRYTGKEADGDSIEVRNQKRYDAALQMKQAWLSRFDQSLNLEIVACDMWGNPLGQPKPAPKTPRACRRRRYA